MTEFSDITTCSVNEDISNEFDDVNLNELVTQLNS
jgi:hypothetical protein